MTEPTHWGATPAEWELFDKTLGLTEALLPVVSNPHATISPGSSVSMVGKLPSTLNSKGHVSGFPAWQDYKIQKHDIFKWSNLVDYGIAINAKYVRGADLDLIHKGTVEVVAGIFEKVLGHEFPIRFRESEARVLIPYKLAGDYPKRVLTFPDREGIVEFLGDGQQFIACGTHINKPKLDHLKATGQFQRERYKWWFPGTPAIPTITPDQFEDIYERIKKEFPGVTEKKSKEIRKEQIQKVKSDCKILNKLYELDLVLDTESDGRVHIICPFADSHTSDTGKTSTTYFPANTGGFADARIKCLHSHCDHRHTEDYTAEIGITMFDDLSEKDPIVSDKLGALIDAGKIVNTPSKFTIFSTVRRESKPLKWIIRDIMPLTAELGMIWGPTGCGKSFMVLDMAYAIARGVPWRGFEVSTPGKVVYIAAEGRRGLPMRIAAYEEKNGITPEDNVPVFLLNSKPNLLKSEDIKKLIAQVNNLGDVRVMFIDTMSSSMPGGNENSAEDMTKLCAYCRELASQTGMLVVLVHHAGKDMERGPRGSSLFGQWVDFDMSIIRDTVHTDRRSIIVNKQRDAEDKQEFGFTLERVAIGVDDDDIPIDSCVIQHTDVLPQRVKKTKGKIQKAILRSIEILLKKTEEYPGRDVLKNHVEKETGSRGYDINNSITDMLRDGLIEELQGLISPYRGET